MRRRTLVGLVALFLSMVATRAAVADARHSFLVRMLRESGEYRVRVQAALSLGEIGSRDATQALVAALDDDHPAVRTAAAAALGRLGDPAAVDALERRNHDSNAGVRAAVRRTLRKLRTVAARPEVVEDRAVLEAGAPAANARYYIGVGDMGNRSGVREEEMKGLLKQYLRDALARTGGVRVAPDGETPQAAARAIRRDRLDGYFLTGSVLKLQQTAPGTIRAEVSVMVLTNPGRDLRMMLNGAAEISARSASDRNAQDQAVRSAATGAVRRLATQLGVTPP